MQEKQIPITEKEIPVMSEEQFKEYIGAGNIRLFEAVSKYKSVYRAIRRGNVSPIGEIYPKRPFNNRKPTAGRHLNEQKKMIYGKLTGRN
jgi:hypothetical protein